mgnify:CR=1 FL=1
MSTPDLNLSVRRQRQMCIIERSYLGGGRVGPSSQVSPRTRSRARGRTFEPLSSSGDSGDLPRVSLLDQPARVEALPPTGVATIAPRLIVVDPEGPTCPEAPEVPQTQLVGPTTAVDVAKRSGVLDTPEAGAERRPAVELATGKPRPKPKGRIVLRQFGYLI